MKSNIVQLLSILFFVIAAIVLSQLFQEIGFAAFENRKTFILASILILCMLVGTWSAAHKGKTIKAKRVSSLLTPLYGVYLPLLSLVLLITTIISLFNHLNDGFVPDRIIIICVFFIWTLIGLKYAKLKMIYFDQSRIYYSNLFGNENCNLSDIKEVKRYMRYLYKIKVQNVDCGMNIVFMSRVKESLDPFTTSTFVEYLRKRVAEK